jgi:hypothetical protein
LDYKPKTVCLQTSAATRVLIPRQKFHFAEKSDIRFTPFPAKI